MTETVLSARRVRKRFRLREGEILALKELDLDVQEQETLPAAAEDTLPAAQDENAPAILDAEPEEEEEVSVRQGYSDGFGAY